jgi:hypothetical protein
VATFYTPAFPGLRDNGGVRALQRALPRSILSPFLHITLQRHENAVFAQDQNAVLNPFSASRYNAVDMPCLARIGATF